MRKIFDLHGLVSVDGLEKVKKGLKDIDGSLKKTSAQLIKTGRNFEKIGSGMTKWLTAPLLAAGAVVTKFGADFEKSMSTSLAIMGDVTDEMKKKMGDTAKKVSEETTFSAAEVAKSYYYLASAGLDAAQSISVVGKVASFATAGQFDLSRATDLLTDAQSALGLSSKNVAENEKNLVRVSDVLVKANTLANASVEQFSESLTNKAGSALKILGKDMEEGVAVLAAYADQGVKGSEAGTQLGIVLRDLQKASIANKSEFIKQKIAVYDSNGEMRSMSEIIGDLEGALSGMSDEQKKTTLSMLGFQEKSVASLLTLVGTSEKIKEYEQDLRKAGGTTDEVAEKQLKNFWDQLTIIKNKLVNVTISLSEQLLPVLKNDIIPIVEKAVEKIKSMSNAFSRLEPKTRSNTLKFIAFAAILGPLILTLGKVISTIGKLRGAVLLLNAAFLSNPIGQVMIAVGLSVFAVTAAVGAWRNWNKEIEENTRLKKENLKIRTVEQVKVEELTTKFDNLTKRMGTNTEALKDEALYTSLYGKDIEELTQLAQDMGFEIVGNTKDHYNLVQAIVDEINYRRTVKEETKTYLQLLKEIKNEKKSGGESSDDTDLQEMEKLVKEIDDRIDKRNEELKNKSISYDEEQLESKINYYKEIVAAMDQGQAAEIAGIEDKDKRALAELEFRQSKELEALKDNEEAKDELVKAHATERANLEKSFDDESIRNKQSALKQLKSLIIDSINAFGDLFMSIYDRRLNEIDKTYDKEKERIDGLSASEEEKARLTEELDAKTDKKRKEILHKQAVLNKAMSIFNINILAGQAIMMAWANVGFPWAIALSIAIGALSSIQTAAVLAQPIPAAKGAFVESHQGGSVMQVGEGSQDELIMPLETGTKALVDQLIKEVNSRPTSTINNDNRQTLRPINLNIGTLISDENGLKELDRRMSRIRVTEAQRMGALT